MTDTMAIMFKALANEIDDEWDSDYNAHDAAARIRELVAEYEKDRVGEAGYIIGKVLKAW
jgi:hypothetical protein